MMSIASAVACTSSTARAAMLQNGLRRISSSEPERARAPRRASGCSRSALRTTRADGPSRYTSPARVRAWSAFDQATWSSSNASSPARRWRCRGRRSRRSGRRSWGTRPDGAARRAAARARRRGADSAVDEVDRRLGHGERLLERAAGSRAARRASARGRSRPRARSADGSAARRASPPGRLPVRLRVSALLDHGAVVGASSIALG